MGLFKAKHKNLPTFSTEKFEPVLRCSICTGEQVFCIIDKDSGEMKELMLISSPIVLNDICKANNIEPSSIRKIY